MDFYTLQRKGWRLVIVMAIAEISWLVVWAIGETTMEPNYVTNSGPHRPLWMNLPFVLLWVVLMLLNGVLGFVGMAHVTSRLQHRPPKFKKSAADSLWLILAFVAPGLGIFLNSEAALYSSGRQPRP